MQEQGREANGVEQDETWRPQSGDELRICGRTVSQDSNLHKGEHGKDSDEDAGKLAEDEVEVGTLL